MFKSIFSKLIVIFISITVVSFSVAGAMLYYYLGYFVSKERVDQLDRTGTRINRFLTIYRENIDNPISSLLLGQALQSFSENTGSIIWIIDRNGHVVISEPSRLSDTIVSKMKRDANGYLVLPDERQYRRVLSGNQDTIKEIGDYYGLFKNTGTSWLILEKPFKYQGNVEAGVLLFTPLPEVQRARSSVFGFFLIATTVSIAVSFVLVYIFSRRISKPLKQINEAARIIAGGEFRQRLDIKTRDEIGELASSFNQMASALQNLENMRRGFIANVSHELRTPMTSIRGFIEGILDGTIPEERQKDYLNIVKQETDRLNRLVNDILDLAKMEAGEVTLNLKAFDINELMRRCVIKLESLILKKGIEVEASFEEEEMPVKADQDAIERVLINLLHNAIKFSNENGKITVGTERKKENIIVTIADCGIGIDESEKNLIWDRFYKSDKSRGKDRSGTGLGLAIVKNIINEHKQEIWVESELGKGAKFSFTLEPAEDAGIRE